MNPEIDIEYICSSSSRHLDETPDKKKKKKKKEEVSPLRNEIRNSRSLILVDARIRDQHVDIL